MSIPRLADYELPRRAEAPANVASWTLDPAKAALLVHDMQRYFVGFYAPASPLVRTLVANIARLAAAARAAGMPVLYTAQPGSQRPRERGLLSDFWGPGLAAEPCHTDIVEELVPHPGDVQLVKRRYSAFFGTSLAARLEAAGRTQLVITGVYAHIGITATALAAFMQDVQPFVPIDAVADFTRAEHLSAMSYVAGCCGAVVDTEAALRALAGARVPASLPALKAAVADKLGVAAGAIADDAYLPDLGLDSIALMELAEQWKTAGVSYVALLEEPSPRAWMQLLSEGDHR